MGQKISGASVAASNGMRTNNIFFIVGILLFLCAPDWPFIRKKDSFPDTLSSRKFGCWGMAGQHLIQAGCWGRWEVGIVRVREGYAVYTNCLLTSYGYYINGVWVWFYLFFFVWYLIWMKEINIIKLRFSLIYLLIYLYINRFMRSCLASSSSYFLFRQAFLFGMCPHLPQKLCYHE